MHRLLLLLPLGLILLLPVVADAGTKRAPRKLVDIQSEIDGTPAGGTVVLGAGEYSLLEGLVVPPEKAGITIRAKGRVVIDGPLVPDGADAEAAPPALLVLAENVSLRGLKFRHAPQDTIQVGTEEAPVDGFRMDRCTVFNGDEDGLVVFGNDVTIVKSTFRACQRIGVIVTGSRVEISRSRFLQLGQAGVFMTGDELTYTRNTMRLIEDNRGVEVVGDRLLVDRSTFFGLQGAAVRVTGDDATVSRVRAEQGDNFAIEGTGDRMTVTRSTILRMGGTGVDIEGNDALVERTFVDQVGGFGISISGNNARVLRSRVGFARSTGVSIQGDECLVDGNTLFAGTHGVSTVGDFATVSGNNILSAGDDGIGVNHSGFALTCERNRVKDANGHGLRLNTSEGTIAGNSVTGCGAEDEAGVEVIGDENEIVGNRVRDCDSSGVRVLGSENVVRDNVCIANTDNGIWISIGNPGDEGDFASTDNVVDGNTCRGNEGEGLQNDGVGTVIRDNTLRGNRLDLTNRVFFGATLIDDGGNRFDTGGLDTAPEIGLH